MIKVVILGAGNVATHLCKALTKSKNIKLAQGYNRTNTGLFDELQIPFTNNISQLIAADVYLMAVSDDAIEELSTALPFENRLVVHTSGSVPMDVISSKQRRGVFYPLQTFSASMAISFQNVPICLETEEQKDLLALEELATALAKKYYILSSSQRNALHVAAVFANNFSNQMFVEAKEICDLNKIPFEILHPLILETAQKIQKLDPQDAQTGPAKRNDQQTIQRHLGTLEDPEQKELYKIITKAIQKYYGKKL